MAQWRHLASRNLAIIGSGNALSYVWYQVIMYSISQEICTRFLLRCALLWLYIDWFSHIHQAYFTNDCPSASKATQMNMDKYFMWIHYERLHNHNKAKHNKTVCIFLGIYCKRMLCYFQLDPREIWNDIQTFSLKKMHLEMSPAKC